jgi:hypothetical protein
LLILLLQRCIKLSQNHNYETIFIATNTNLIG